MWRREKKMACHLLGLQPLFAIERLVATEGWVAGPVSSRRRNCSTAPLTEPYVRTTHTALWTDVSEWQHKLP